MLARVRRSLFDALSARWFYGWIVLAVAFIGMFGTGPGQSHLIGLFFEPIAGDLNLSLAVIATAYGSATLVAGLAMPLVGRLIDRLGPTVMLWLVSLGLGAIGLLFSLVSSWPQLAVGFVLLRFLGQGALMLTCATLISHWFHERRGLALGLMMLGFPLSLAVHPLVGQWLIEHHGWQQAWIVLGLSTWVLLLPPMLLFAHSTPERVGLQPFGLAGRSPNGPAAELTGMTLPEALRTADFYIIAAGIFTLSLLLTTLHVHNKSILTSHGLSARSATGMFAVVGVVAAITMPMIGRMLDRYRPSRMFAGGLAALAVATAAVTLVRGPASGVVYAVLFGLCNGIALTYFVYMWPRFFGRRHLGAIQGLGQLATVLGAAIGPIPLAVARERTGDYDRTLWLLALLPVLVAVVALFMSNRPVGQGTGGD